MRISSRAATIGLLAGMVGGLAEAAVLQTPAVVLPAGTTHVVSCSIVSLASQPREAKIEYINNLGNAVIVTNVTLPAFGSHATHTTSSNGTSANTSHYCRFTVPDVAKANLRGGIVDTTNGASFPAE